MFVFSPVSVNQISLFGSVSVRLWGQHAPVSEVSPLMSGRKEKESSAVLTLFVLRLTVSTFLPNSSERQARRCCTGVAGQRPRSTGHFPPKGGGSVYSLLALILSGPTTDCLHITAQQTKTPKWRWCSAVAGQKSRSTGHFPPKGGEGKARSVFLACQSLHDMRATKSLLVLSCFCG